MRYVHTNLVAHDWKLLSAFYQDVFGCTRIGEGRDLRGDWLDRLTGLKDVQVVGEHLRLPGYGVDGPTIEIFSYSFKEDRQPPMANRLGFGHLAFLVDDVADTLERVRAGGGGALGELVSVQYGDGRVLTAVYATDPEGNILELQNWS